MRSLPRLVSGICAALVAAFALPVAPAYAEETRVTPVDDVFDRGCGDDNGTDRCDTDIQRTMRDLYGWEAAEALLEQGVQFRRFMMVDGYGRDVLGVAFERRPGASPIVRVDVPEGDRNEGAFNLPPSAPLTAVVSLEHWNRALETTQLIDQQLTREVGSSPEKDGDTITICLHGWFTVIESGDPVVSDSGAGASSELLRDAEGACAKGLSMPAAFELADVAYGLLTECHQLDDADFRNRIMLLALCKRLGGDRMAAAHALKTVKRLEDRFHDSLRSDSDLSLESFFAFDRKAEAAELERRLQGATVYLGAPHAINRKEGVVIGTFSPAEQPPEDENAYRFAEIRLELRNRGRVWTIEAYQMSDVKTVRYPDEENEE